MGRDGMLCLIYRGEIIILQDLMPCSIFYLPNSYFIPWEYNVWKVTPVWFGHIKCVLLRRIPGNHSSGHAEQRRRILLRHFGYYVSITR